MAGKLCIHIVWNASSNIRHCYDIKLAANECKTNILTVEGCTHLMTTPREVHDTIVCFILPQFIPQCSNQLIYILFFQGFGSVFMFQQSKWEKEQVNQIHCMHHSIQLCPISKLNLGECKVGSNRWQHQSFLMVPGWLNHTLLGLPKK